MNPPRPRFEQAGAGRWLVTLLLLLAGCDTPTLPPGDGANARAPSFEAAHAVPASAQTRAAFALLGPGVNFGNMLEALREGDWGARFEDDHAATVRSAGFGHVRLPVRWSAHASPDAQARIDAVFMARVDAVVERLLGQGLTVVLNMHHYRQLDGDRLDAGEPRVDRGDLQPRFLAMWRQIAEHFARHPDRLWFELYNEPHGELAAGWNDLASRALRVVRQSNPQRVVVIGPVQWNNARALERLRLPPDDRLVVTVHNYEPFRFTHQQADWADPEVARARGEHCCNDAQRRQLVEPLEIAKRWSDRHGVPVWLGEFGAYGGPPGRPNDMASRTEYTRLVREAAERRGIQWAYWEFASGFGAYDPKARQWREPLRDALLGR